MILMQREEEKWKYESVNENNVKKQYQKWLQQRSENNNENMA